MLSYGVEILLALKSPQNLSFESNVGLLSISTLLGVANTCFNLSLFTRKEVDDTRSKKKVAGSLIDNE